MSRLDAFELLTTAAGTCVDRSVSADALGAQRLVTAAVTKHGTYFPACSRPDCLPRWAGGDRNEASFSAEPRFALAVAGLAGNIERRGKSPLGASSSSPSTSSRRMRWIIIEQVV
ncbi:MAG: hypothetical protein ACREP9_11440 [Candidatus Dormibacteraceae bacterium]